MLKAGFTIVELMVVIAIIGVLTVMTIFALNPDEIFKRARDSNRISDLQTIRKAIDLSLSDGNIFDTARCSVSSPCNSLGNSRLSDGSGYVNINLSKYLPTLPIDPKWAFVTFIDGKGQTVSSSYQFATDGTDYELRGHLESKVNTSSSSGEDKYTVDGGCSSDWYEVGTNLCLIP